MRRTVISAAITAVVLALATTGCGGGGSGSSNEDPATATGTLRVLTPSYPASNEGKAEFQKVVDKFHETYPQMTVEPDYATYNNLNEKISTSIAGGTPYDVLVSGVGWVQPFADRGVYADLAPYGVTPQTLSEQLLPALAAPATYEDKVYAYPFIIDARAIGFRKSAFKKAGLDPDNPPVTFDEIKAAAEKLTERDASGRITKPGFDFNTSPGNYRQAFVILLASTGTPLYLDGKPNFNNAKGVEVLEWMKSMINNVQPFGQQNAAQKPMVLTDEANMGFVGSSMDCSSDGIGQKNCDDLGFLLPDNGKQAEMVGGDLASIGARSQNKDAAWAFIQAMTSPELEDAAAVLNNKIPASASKDVAENAESLDNALAKFTSDHLDDAIYEGGPANWLDVRNVFGPTIDDVLLGKVSAQDALAQIEAKAQ